MEQNGQIDLAELERTALDVQFLIVKGGGIATKSSIEDYLTARYGIDRYTGHQILNDLERRNVRAFVVSCGQVYWNQAEMMRTEPRPETYPDLVFETL